MTQTPARRLSIGLGGLFIGLILLFSHPQTAQAGWLDFLFNTNVTEATDNLVTAGENGELGKGSLENNADNVLGSTGNSLLVRLVGVPSSTLQKATPEQRAMLQKKYGNGAISDVSGAIAFLYRPPASSEVFVADLLDSAGIVPKAQAQGLGFASLDPLLATWKRFRDLALISLAGINIVIGILIISKVQLGKTMVTLQSAIPQMFATALAIIFSYPISGFAIDIMYVSMYLLVGMFPAADSASLLDKNFLELGQAIIQGDGMRAGAFKSFADAVDHFVQATVNSPNIGPVDVNGTFGAIAGITMSLIMAVAILVGVFKLFFELLKTYVTIILLIAFSPLLLMFGAIPGQDVFKSWLTDLCGNLLAFPTTLLIIIVFRMFTSPDPNVLALGNPAIETGGFMPPFLIGRGSGGALTTLVGIGIVLIMPELIVQMKKAVGVKDGIFTVLAKDMMSNFGKNFQAAQPAFPLAGAAAGNVIGRFNGGADYLKEHGVPRNAASMTEFGKAIRSGGQQGANVWGSRFNTGGERLGRIASAVSGESNGATGFKDATGWAAGKLGWVDKSKKKKEDEDEDDGHNPPRRG